jgi:hypothetical protein
MTNENLITRIRPGMQVQGADGRPVGKVTEVWIGADPRHSSERCDEEECSRLQVHHGAATLYIPYNAIADVAGTTVRLTLEAATVNERGWYRKPLWIPEDAPPSAWPFDHPRGGTL